MKEIRIRRHSVKWIVKRFAGKWVRRCPYCSHITVHDDQPGDRFVCRQCTAIVNPVTYQRLQKCARELWNGLEKEKYSEKG